MWIRIRIQLITFGADPDPDLAYHSYVNSDLDPACHFDADQDSSFQFDADLDPQHNYIDNDMLHLTELPSIEIK